MQNLTNMIKAFTAYISRGRWRFHGKLINNGKTILKGSSDFVTYFVESEI